MTFKVGDRVRYSANSSWGGAWQNCKIVALPPVGETYYDVSNHEGKIGIMRAEEMELIQTTQTASDRLERLETFVARVAERLGGSGSDLYAEARHLVAEVEPDRDLVMAREACAIQAQRLNDYGLAAEYRAGENDDQFEVKAAIEALRRARDEGNEA